VLYRRFADSLRDGGILFVGGTETVSSLSELPLRSTAISFYQKQPTH
jgi:chemotaxis methyl-accepting protein methylase